MRYPKLETLMTQLIAAPSVSSVSPEWDQSNLGVIELLAGWCRDKGFTVEVLEIPGHPGKYNMIATAGQGPDGLVLAGHTDTVPFDESLWHSDPFRVTERDNRWHGLGTADMKGFFAVVLEALRDLDLASLQQPLVILATADEESSMCGARSLMDSQRLLGRHAVIGEPTGLKPIRMHKGITMEAIRIMGRSGHSSDPSLGRNALEGMHRVIGELLRWRDDLQQRHQHSGFRIAVPTLNLGHIHGGDNPNRICGSCELHFDLRPLPGMDIELLRAEIEQRVGDALADSDFTFERRALFEGIPAMETPATAAIVQAAEAMTGHSAGSVAFGTEGPYLNALQMETIILGPGHIDQAHQPDEYVGLDQLDPGMRVIRGLVKHFCLSE